MRVLHVLDSCGAGGIETTFLNVLRAFPAVQPPTVALQHDVLALSGGALEAKYAEAAHRLIIATNPEEIDGVLSGDYDVVHVLFERAAHRVLPRVMARSHARCVYNKGYDLSSTYRMEDSFRWLADDSLVAACDEVAFTTLELAAEFPAAGPRHTVLGKAFDGSAFLSVPEPSADTPDRVLCVANLHAGKRIADLIPMLARVRVQCPLAQVRIVGRDSGGHAERLRELAVASGVSSAVDVAGARFDIPAELSGSRVFVLPSLREGVPTVLLEAMAAGRPVVATRVGHVATIVTDGVEGFLVEPGDIEVMADRVTRLLADRALADRMGRAARARAAGFDVEPVAARLLRVLTDQATEHATTRATAIPAAPEAAAKSASPAEPGQRVDLDANHTLAHRLRLLADIGNDRFVSLRDLPPADQHDGFVQSAWDIYTREFDRFTGATLDPAFARLRRRDAPRGHLHLPDDSVAVIVGTGPSLSPCIDDLRALRDRVVILTSPRGAQALARRGLNADVVLTIDSSPLEAELTRQMLRASGDEHILATASFVAVHPRTPPSLLRGVDTSRVFTPDPPASWGLWPAAAVAMALGGGARTLALVGVDLGTEERPDPVYRSTSVLLELLSTCSGARCIDLSFCGAAKSGWPRGAWTDLAGAAPQAHAELVLDWTRRSCGADEECGQALSLLAPVITAAEAGLDAAGRARESTSPDAAALSKIGAQIMAWGHDPDIRRAVQDVLGASLLPRIWRLGLDSCPAERLWQPITLALHELLAQARALMAIHDTEIAVEFPAVHHEARW